MKKSACVKRRYVYSVGLNAFKVRTSFLYLVWPNGKALSPFLIGGMFLRELSWKYSAKLVGS